MQTDVELNKQEERTRQARPNLQSGGFLLGLSSDWRINCASQNLAAFTGLDAASALGRSISSVFTGDAVHLIRNRVALLRDEDSPERVIDQMLIEGGPRFDACLRLSGGGIVFEAVRGTDPGGIDVAGAVERMLTRIEDRTDVRQLAEAATRELRGLTGFDGIQICRNGGDAPECIGSFVRSGLSEFEPANVHSAALRRPLWIADIEAEPVPILCAADERMLGEPGILAAPGAAMAEEIRRTSARSAVLLPITGASGGWGFALALHKSVRAPRLARLSAAELFARVLGLKIEALEAQSAVG